MKILYITTIGTTMGFFTSFIRSLLDEGNTVDIATNENNGETKVPDCYREWGCRVFPISCTRSPLDVLKNIKTIKEIRQLVKREKYDIVHCHTPIAAFCTRIACRKLREKQGVKIIYTAHGFHFYTGAPIKNWLIFYPIEWVCSWWTDVLITINKEDYERAKKHFHAKKTVYVPGVGIDTKKFAPMPNNREKIRKMLGVKDDQIILLSVGELNENKNHEAVIRAIADYPDILYVIVGKGELEEHLSSVIREFAANVILTGFKEDVSDFYDAADAFILPSIREGLNVSLMEAMASGLAVACSNIRGNTDLIDDENCLFNPRNTEKIKTAIEYAVKNKTDLGIKNLEKIRMFDLSSVEGHISATAYTPHTM